MNIIIPIAGEGKRLRPHTHTKPKPLLPVAGKPMIDHIMDKILPLKPHRVYFIVGHLKHRLEHHIKTTYKNVDVRFIEQKELNGTAGAVQLAKEAFSEDVLIDFGDTIFDADLSVIAKSKDDGIIWVMPVKDYQRFGVVVTDENGYMTKIVEKPSTPVSKLANIGLYYVKNTKLLAKGIELVIKNCQPGKEAYLTDAFQYMIQNGAKIKTLPCEAWYDCGTADTLLETNRALLREVPKKTFKGFKVVHPVAIHPSAVIENSTIGPNVSIGADVQIRNSKVKNSILDDRCEVEDADLAGSIIGVEASVKGAALKAIVGDHSRVESVKK
jgi:glucose-1-phosphate thymidylyltransferase